MRISAIAETVKQLHRRGLTVREISQEIGHSEGYTSQLISGKRGISGFRSQGRPRKPALNFQVFGHSAELVYEMGRLCEKHGAKLMKERS